MINEWNNWSDGRCVCWLAAGHPPLKRKVNFSFLLLSTQWMILICLHSHYAKTNHPFHSIIKNKIKFYFYFYFSILLALFFSSFLVGLGPRRKEEKKKSVGAPTAIEWAERKRNKINLMKELNKIDCFLLNEAMAAVCLWLVCWLWAQRAIGN